MSRYGVRDSQLGSMLRAAPLILACSLYLGYHFFLGPNAHGQGEILNSHPSHNRSLGFGEILVAIVPSSTAEKFHHQLDTLSLTSYRSNIDLKKFEGGGDKKFTKIWKGHMNMLRYVLDHNLETALIMEGDADWDLHIKDQLQTLSENLPGATDEHPYGTDWMALWLSHCEGDDGTGDVFEQLRVYTDDSLGYFIDEDVNDGRPAREIWRNQKSGCTTAYAVSAAGAQKILDDIGFEHVNLALEKAEGGSYDLPGLVIFPPLFEKWTADEGASNMQSGGTYLTNSIRRATHMTSKVPSGGRSPGA